MPSHTNLVRRKGVYYFRMRVPSDLVPVLGREFNASLRTSDRREALARLRSKQGEAQERIDRARGQRNLRISLASERLTRSKAESLLIGWFEVERERVLLRDRVRTDHAEIHSVIDELEAECDRLQSPVPADYEPSVGRTLNRLLFENGVAAQQPFKNVTLVAPAAGRIGVDFAPGVHEWLFEATRAGLLDLCSLRLDRFYGVRRAPAAETAPAPSVAGHESLERLISDFASDPTRGRRTGKTELDYGMVFGLLREIIGPHRPLASVTRQDCREVQRILTLLPRDSTKRFPGKTFREAAELRGSSPGLKLTTINSHLTKVSTLFNWAVKEQRLTQSPAKGLAIKNEDVGEEEGRRPFTIGELNRIFSAPLYTGCMDDERNFAKIGAARPRRSRFWVPLIALFSGLRQNEICQLAASDIEEIDGVAVIQVRSSKPWQRLKTSTARRVVPIHPELIAIGLPKYAADMRAAKHEQLFPELQPDGRGYMSGIFQKRFNTFRKSVGITDPEGVFHSFRHTWRDALREAGIQGEVADQLGGWSGVGEGSEYGRGLSPRSRLTAIERIRYAGLRLDHLKV